MVGVMGPHARIGPVGGPGKLGGKAASKDPTRPQNPREELVGMVGSVPRCDAESSRNVPKDPTRGSTESSPSQANVARPWATDCLREVNTIVIDMKKLCPLFLIQIVLLASLACATQNTPQPQAVNEKSNKERPACLQCQGAGKLRCPMCALPSAGGKADIAKDCSMCKGTRVVTCLLCRGSGKALILEDVLSPADCRLCGINKLTVAEQWALQKEMLNLYWDRWDSAAAKYLEHKDWTRATVTRVARDKLHVETMTGLDIILDETLPLLGVGVGSKIWLESVYGLTEVIGPNGDTGSYFVE